MIRSKTLTLLAALSFLLFPSALKADESSEAPAPKLDTKEYSPDYCEFTASFPEEPYIHHRCEGKTEDTCYNLISYTKVFEMSSTVKVKIICNPTTPEVYAQYTPEVMKATVKALAKGKVVKTHEINTRQESTYRQASLLGQGRFGLYDSIFISQLWMGQNSIMSVEAELSGEQVDQADQVFADILRSIGYTEDIKGNAE